MDEARSEGSAGLLLEVSRRLEELIKTFPTFRIQVTPCFFTKERLGDRNIGLY